MERGTVGMLIIINIIPVMETIKSGIKGPVARPGTINNNPNKCIFFRINNLIINIFFSDIYCYKTHN